MRTEDEHIKMLGNLYRILTEQEYLIGGVNDTLHYSKMLLWSMGYLDAKPSISYRDTPDGKMYDLIFEQNGKPVWYQKDIIPIIESVLMDIGKG